LRRGCGKETKKREKRHCFRAGGAARQGAAHGGALVRAAEQQIVRLHVSVQQAAPNDIFDSGLNATKPAFTTPPQMPR
jgi:hypothetical protein